MDSHFFSLYRPLFGSIVGMFTFDAALLMTAYAQLAAEEGIRSNTLEIGVHHGLSALVVAALRAEGAQFVAIDLFEELQQENVSHSGAGDRQRFLSNMARIHVDQASFMRVIAAPSSSLSPDELGRKYSLCHIDGGHSAEETYGDLVLCSEILVPGGVLVIDDYFNPGYPGVSEGAIRFMIENRQVLSPMAIGFNKVIFQKGATSRLNEVLLKRFPRLQHTAAQLWGEPVFLFGSNFGASFDLDRSTPHELVVRDKVSMQVKLNPQVPSINGCPGEIVPLPILVENESDIVLCFSNNPIGLSYHLMTRTGEMLAYDNARKYFYDPLGPGHQGIFEVLVSCPESAGRYQLEIDLVWEGICWFKQQGNTAPVVGLDVV